MTTATSSNNSDDAGPLLVRNTAQAAGAPSAPQRADGTPWRFEMIFRGGSWRAYAQTPSALVEALIPGYRDLTTPTAAAEARIRLACGLQVRLQAGIVAGTDPGELSDEERAFLTGDFSKPPVIDRWTASVPLVLVRTFYDPIGHIPAPEGDTIWWIDPSEDWELLVSLAEAGAINIAEHRPAGAPPGQEHRDGRR